MVISRGRLKFRPLQAGRPLDKIGGSIATMIGLNAALMASNDIFNSREMASNIRGEAMAIIVRVDNMASEAKELTFNALNMSSMKIRRETCQT